MPRRCSFKLELDYPQPLAGVDEAGCAPLAGPVVAGACILDRDKFPRRNRRFEEYPRSKSARRFMAGWSSRRSAWGVGDRQRSRKSTSLTSLGEDAGDDPGGRGAGAFTGLGARRRKRPSEVAKAIEGDRRWRCQVVCSIGGSLDPRQSHSRPDHGRFCTSNIRAMAGSGTADMGTPEHSARSPSLGPTPLHRRSFPKVRAGDRKKLVSRSWFSKFQRK